MIQAAADIKRMLLAMAASYDPDPQRPERIRLPFDLRTCTIDPERWQAWLEFDPLNLLEKHADALRTLHGLFIDVGMYDQYRIQYGLPITVLRYSWVWDEDDVLATPADEAVEVHVDEVQPRRRSEVPDQARLHVLDVEDEAQLIARIKARYVRPLQEIFEC